METVYGLVILMIMLGAVLFPIGMFLFVTFASVFGTGVVSLPQAERKVYVGITPKSYDFDED